MKFTTAKTRLFALLSIATSVLIMASCTSSNSSNSSNSSSKENDWKLYNLSGKVKSFKQTTYYADLYGEIKKGDNFDGYAFYREPPLIPQNTWAKYGWSLQFMDGNKQVIFNQKGNTVEIKGYYSSEDGYLYKYDKQGNRIKENTHDPDGYLVRNRLYDEKGNLIEENEYYYNNFYEKIIYKYFFVDRNLKYKTLYKYDEEGNLIEENEYDPNGDLSGKKLYEYDGKGNLIEENEYLPNGDLRSKNPYEYEYDEKGNLIGRYEYSGYSGDLLCNTLYKYDEEGNLIEENEYKSHPYNDRQWHVKQLYDKQGNRIQRNEYNLNGDLDECRLYDEKGNIIEMRRYKSNEPIEIITCKFDEKGNYVEVIKTYNPWEGEELNYTYWPWNRDEYKYEYEFDNKGNWINRLGFRNDRQTKITEREIEYFD